MAIHLVDACVYFAKGVAAFTTRNWFQFNGLVVKVIVIRNVASINWIEHKRCPNECSTTVANYKFCSRFIFWFLLLNNLRYAHLSNLLLTFFIKIVLDQPSAKLRN